METLDKGGREERRRLRTDTLRKYMGVRKGWKEEPRLWIEVFPIFPVLML